ncbi:endodeoxyribonuclease [Agrobacterium tumefaciens]|uniref:endodeoxyribonuclease n=1 Tax=Agrobacterium tumefaciens TaxID=358 RepID=UPI000DD0A35F|nr:endodeoxyribonuclease [Agrobacterium tumefaciens]UXT83576.1 endodeoxyribonuclease [Agrobacterium tumefaciens]
MTFRNKFEAKVAAQLGDGFAYEAKRLPYTLSHKYLPDFINEATKEIVEAKGRFPASDRAKMLAVAAQYPGYRVTIVFQNPDAPINKNSSTTYSGWCEKHGIAWRKA